LIVNFPKNAACGIYEGIFGEVDIEQVCGVAFSPSGRIVVSGAIDNEVRFWDIHGDTQVQVLRGESPMACGALSRNARRVVTSSWSEGIRIWDGQTGEQLRSLEVNASWPLPTPTCANVLRPTRRA